LPPTKDRFITVQQFQQNIVISTSTLLHYPKNTPPSPAWFIMA
jgi:hypothetical protein